MRKAEWWNITQKGQIHLKSFKEPRYTLGTLATTAEDPLHIYDGHNRGHGGSKIAN